MKNNNTIYIIMLDHDDDRIHYVEADHKNTAVAKLMSEVIKDYQSIEIIREIPNNKIIK